jgi:hypothetical protein
MPAARSRPATWDAERILERHMGSRARPGAEGAANCSAEKMKSETPAQGDAWGWGRR